jgi:hypothetical protein
MIRPRTPALATLLIALPVLAADSLQVKTGLWEITTVANNSGIAIPADRLAKMPPEQRARMEEMMKQMAARGPRTNKDKSCVTEKELKEGAFRSAANAQPNCKYTQVSATARRQEITFQCSGEGRDSTSHMVMEAPDSTHVRGTIEARSGSTTINIRITGQWLSASCAGADKD